MFYMFGFSASFYNSYNFYYHTTLVNTSPLQMPLGKFNVHPRKKTPSHQMTSLSVTPFANMNALDAVFTIVYIDI